MWFNVILEVTMALTESCPNLHQVKRIRFDKKNMEFSYCVCQKNMETQRQSGLFGLMVTVLCVGLHRKTISVGLAVVTETKAAAAADF